MKKLLSVVATSCLFSSALFADALGIEAGIAYWSPAPTGIVQDGSTKADMEHDLGFDNDTSYFFWASLEHFIPLIPNFKINHTQFDVNANAKLIRNINFHGKNYTVNDSVDSNLKLNQTDFILYYQFLDTVVSVDAGFNFKYFDGELSVKSSTAEESSSFTLVVPMLYAKAGINIPTTGLSVQADLSYIGYNEHKFYDAKAFIGYEATIGLLTKIGVQAGYRMEKLNVEYDKKLADIDVKGPFGAVYLHF